ncbi:hypothetical protein GOODEAATRI_022321 [Goodea atripinnis]|uniref:Uncharacterized protein n=1 Tax=Goodea atripinnis TaxID=208336 RepID=A0ABV0NQP9_9TELE
MDISGSSLNYVFLSLFHFLEQHGQGSWSEWMGRWMELNTGRSWKKTHSMDVSYQQMDLHLMGYVYLHWVI